MEECSLARERTKESGQSTVEFALTLVLLLAFIFFYFQLTMIFAFGNFVHYATFMSARAYSSAGGDPSDQRDRAKLVIVRLLKRSEGQAGIDKFPSVAKGVGGSDVGGFSVDAPPEYQADNRDYSWMQGVRYTFRSKLFIIPLAGMGPAGKKDLAPNVNSMTLTSESWLGREPSYMECQDEMARFSGLFDNGC